MFHAHFTEFADWGGFEIKWATACGCRDKIKLLFSSVFLQFKIILIVEISVDHNFVMTDSAFDKFYALRLVKVLNMI